MTLEPITVSVSLTTDINTAWMVYTEPMYIQVWNHASNDWECPKAVNDLRAGGSFAYTMGAKDKSVVFDLVGIYNEVIPHSKIAYVMPDGRKVITTFEHRDNQVIVTQIFDPETVNPPGLQSQGWQNILDNYKKASDGDALTAVLIAGMV
jgi:uncharacterized protein YndB with AHSA1/START domain